MGIGENAGFQHFLLFPQCFQKATFSYRVSESQDCLVKGFHVIIIPVPSLRPLDESVIISEIEPDSLRLSWKRPMYDLATPVTYKVEMLEFPLTDWKCIASSIPETTYRVLGLNCFGFYAVSTVFQLFNPFPNKKFYSLPTRKRLQMTISNLIKMAESSLNR